VAAESVAVLTATLAAPWDREKRGSLGLARDNAHPVTTAERLMVCKGDGWLRGRSAMAAAAASTTPCRPAVSAFDAAQTHGNHLLGNPPLSALK
jgi:hypothetical protein